MSWAEGSIFARSEVSPSLALPARSNALRLSNAHLVLGTGDYHDAGDGAPLQTMLNETTFDNYHLFRADAQILSAGNSDGGSIPDAPVDASSKSADSPSATLAPQANDTSGSAAPTTPIAGAAAESAAKSEGAAPASEQSTAATTEPSAAPVPSAATVLSIHHSSNRRAQRRNSQRRSPLRLPRRPLPRLSSPWPRLRLFQIHLGLCNRHRAHPVFPSA